MSLIISILEIINILLYFLGLCFGVVVIKYLLVNDFYYFKSKYDLWKSNKKSR